MKKKVQICHLTTVHKRTDTRIFIKECTSLHHAGFSVALVVADGLGDAERDGIRIFDLGKPNTRKERLLKFGTKCFEKAMSLEAEVYHFHDPELIPVGNRLAKRGKKVIYDAHEDVPNQLLHKQYLKFPLNKILSFLFKNYEKRSASKYAAVLTATPIIRDKFLPFNKKVYTIHNFPLLHEFDQIKRDGSKPSAVCYVGDITESRGIRNMVDAMEHTRGISFLLGGRFDTEALQEQVEQKPGWSRVKALGYIDREQVREVFRSSFAGLVMLSPSPSYKESIPVKMFEYMAAGLPVIASDFPYWRTLIEAVDCCVFVQPEDPRALGDAIMELSEMPERVREMGARGRQAVLDTFNWNMEEKELIRIYRSLLGDD